MSKAKAQHKKCFVFGCKDQHKSLHRLPTSEDRRAEWIKFIFDGPVPPTVGKHIFVCANHFEPDCFTNLGQYNAGLAGKLFLKDGVLPTLWDTSGTDRSESTARQLEPVRHVACQTDTVQRHTVGTQLSTKTLGPHFRSTGTQTTLSGPDVGVHTPIVAFTTSQPFLPPAPIRRPCKRPRLEVKEEEEEEEVTPFEGSSSMGIHDPPGSTYDPADSVTASTESADVAMEFACPVHKTPTYIVYESCLLELFEACPVCQLLSDVRTRRLGTFLSVEQQCPHCHFSRRWNSQPILGSTPAGNLQLSAAVYTTGASFFKLEKIFKAMQLKLFQYDTFQRHTRTYIEPAIVHRWNAVQEAMMAQLSQQQNVVLGGDLRADSPGHSAKFGSYTMMDLKSNTVVDLQLVQSSEAGGRCHMEKEGLKRSLALLEARGVTLASVVTDRHPEIQKLLREANITHYYDVWHMEKGLSRKLLKISQNKECEKLKRWLHTIKNHIYWTAASSTSGPERVAKWTSILKPLQDTHEDPADPQCLHPQCTSRDKSKCLTAGTPAFHRLEKVLTSKRILEDVEKLSPHYQTLSLEAFHNVIRRFVPKNAVFTFLGMLCRLYLAALHFNENAGRPQGTASADYVDDLLDLIFHEVIQDPAPYLDEVMKIPIPEDVSAQFETPVKQEVIVRTV